MRPRHASGAASICSSVNDTGRPRSSDSFTIHAISRSGASRSSPDAPSGASSNTARPPRCIARPSANSSSSAANVPGTGRPSMARWPSVRDVEKPSAPASIASCTIGAIAAISSGVAGSLRRAPLPHRVRAHRAVRHLHADVDAELPARRARRGTRGTSPSSSRCPRCSAVPGMSSTPSISEMSHSSSPGRTGANPTPQLPATTVVTP